jgi:tellurite resistance protein
MGLENLNGIFKAGHAKAESFEKEFSHQVEVAKTEVTLAKILSFDQFEVAYNVAKSDGEVSSVEKKLLDKIRAGESTVDIYSKAKPNGEKSNTVQDSIAELQGMVENIKPTRVTKAQALRIAYDVAGIDGEVKDSETKAIDKVLEKAKSGIVKPEIIEETPEKGILSSAQNVHDVLGLPKAKIKIEDPFVAALLMAIENDGKIDKKELKHLKKLERSSAKKARPKKRRSFKPLFRMHINFGSFFRFNFFGPRRFKRIKIKTKTPKLNHNIREAFKLAALDGKINTAEIKQLKNLF